MLQAIGITSAPRKNLPPAVDDLTFEAHPGRVTALLGEPGAGKTTALRLMLQLEPGRGVTYFRGRPLHRIPHPSREVGVLLGDVPGHPARTVRSQLRMLCAAVGVPADRADTLLDVVGIAGLRDERLGSLSLGMDRRVGIAAALLADPCTLLLDDPSDGLSPRDRTWLHGLLRGHATLGGAVLFTTSDPKEAARSADRVVCIEGGRLVADQEATEFARTRLRPRVAVRTPYAARLATLLGREARAARRSVEVVEESGSRLSVYGSSCAEIGEAAYRHGVLLHQLADETVDSGPHAAVPHPAPGASEPPAPGPSPSPSPVAPAASHHPAAPTARDTTSSAPPPAGAPSPALAPPDPPSETWTAPCPTAPGPTAPAPSAPASATWTSSGPAAAALSDPASATWAASGPAARVPSDPASRTAVAAGRANAASAPPGTASPAPPATGPVSAAPPVGSRASSAPTASAPGAAGRPVSAAAADGDAAARASIDWGRTSPAPTDPSPGTPSPYGSADAVSGGAGRAVLESVADGAEGSRGTAGEATASRAPIGTKGTGPGPLVPGPASGGAPAAYGPGPSGRRPGTSGTGVAAGVVGFDATPADRAGAADHDRSRNRSVLGAARTGSEPGEWGTVGHGGPSGLLPADGPADSGPYDGRGPDPSADAGTSGTADGPARPAAQGAGWTPGTAAPRPFSPSDDRAPVWPGPRYGAPRPATPSADHEVVQPVAGEGGDAVPAPAEPWGDGASVWPATGYPAAPRPAAPSGGGHGGAASGGGAAGWATAGDGDRAEAWRAAEVSDGPRGTAGGLLPDTVGTRTPEHDDPAGAWPRGAGEEAAGGASDAPGPVRDGEGRRGRHARALPPIAPPLTVRRVGGPLRPLRYELRRAFGTRTATVVVLAATVLSTLFAVLLARGGQVPQPRLLAAWPGYLPLPPAALGAGLLGALSFGEEYRYPALAADRGTVPRRLGLLLAKLGVSATLALLIGALAVAADAGALRLVYDADLIDAPANWIAPGASWAGLLVGCAWAGVLASGVFRATTAGVAAVLAVPVAVVPLVRKVLDGPAAHTTAGIAARLRHLAWAQVPPEADRVVMGALRVMAQPVGTALVLSLMVLMCAYGFTGLRSRVHW
ncbi:ATP-binding cassette domain-containing protein [Streptomyces sp. NPDC093225]|uniref:ATP-binding cassette domain-containing protein n=1 Tax=Streptomyces sp. NPDC093225 TaxID=3366034 RepID=UPI003821D9FB